MGTVNLSTCSVNIYRVPAVSQALYTTPKSGVPNCQRTDILSKALKNEWKFDQWRKEACAKVWGFLEWQEPRNEVTGG